MSNKINQMFQMLEDNAVSSEDVLNIFLNYHGTQILDDDFIEFLKDEGYHIED